MAELIGQHHQLVRKWPIILYSAKHQLLYNAEVTIQQIITFKAAESPGG